MLTGGIFPWIFPFFQPPIHGIFQPQGRFLEHAWALKNEARQARYVSIHNDHFMCFFVPIEIADFFQNLMIEQNIFKS